ncbi:DUF5979 domain-containing protein [Microbacterium sp. SSW1-59]|uniref:DUF5979 domain-containing protein n=1 Tax=Microbacterium xanthum TaxID=3079794 RepID=UPI002AD43BCF|nr:DUF5979 domain-containing protein [Microbacterium sp. SSW1-59]MDZ8201353.1 DUF5979 domain-containing protein [Microbacterium sp. SSW1-59]
MSRRTPAHRASATPIDRPRWLSRRHGWLAASLSFLLAITIAPLPAYAETDTDGQNTIGVEKTVAGADGAVPSLAPGDPVTYEIDLECSSLSLGICLGAHLTDSVPEPLELESVTVSPGGVSRDDSDIAAGLVDVVFTQSNEAGTGLLPSTVTVTVNARVPDDITWQEAQDLGEVTNTATFVSDGLEADSSAGIRVEVPEELAATATKTVDPTDTIPAVAGLPVDFTVGGANTSNRPVDSVTVTEPGAGTENLEYLDITGFGPITPPAGADQFTLSWTDDTGSHTAGPYDAPADAIPDEAGVDPRTVTEISFTFTASDGGQLPPADDEGDVASIGVATETNALVDDLEPNESVQITNVVEATVTVDDRSASDTADATATVTSTPPSVEITKGYDKNVLIGGESTTATVRVDNTGPPVESMTITDPTAGQPDFAAQGIVFGGFTDDLEWPRDATSAEITYTYADGTTETLTTDTVDTLPAASDASEVVGFEVTYTGDIRSSAYAALPYTVTAEPVTGDDDVVTTNTVDTAVVDPNGEDATADAEADLTRRPVRVWTEVDKEIVQDDLYSRPGASSTVQIEGSVRPDSSVGSEYLVIQDPVDPSGTPSAFWNHFDLIAVGPVDVPQNATMTVEYWDADAEEWVAFPGMPVPPGETWSYSVPADMRDDISGIRYTFEPSEPGEVLEPGFTVLTYMQVGLRDELRDGSGPASGNDVTGTLANDAQSQVENPDTGQGVVTDDDLDDIELLPIDGDGPDLVDKTWSPDQVTALSGTSTDVTLSWGTRGIPMDTMTLTDPSGAQGLPIEDSVFDAFDLTGIAAITADTDPGIPFDQVYFERLTAAGDWVTLGDGFTAANPSIGGYPGYSLTEAERADTVGLRAVYAESPDRASAITDPSNDPAVGSGVAATVGQDRDLTLRFGLRDYLRSIPTQPVLGTNHDYTYNTGTPGLVVNTVEAVGVEGDETYRSADSDDITIVDQVMDVRLTKRFVDWDPNLDNPWRDSVDVTTVGLPQAGTPAEEYPGVTALIQGNNDSVTKVATMTITDPDPDIAETITDEFDLYRIADLTFPVGSDHSASVVTVFFDGGGSAEYTIAQAEALAPEELRDVVGISVFHTGEVAADGTYTSMIEPGAHARMRLEYQLRATNRTTEQSLATTGGTPLVNHAVVDQTRPGADASGPVTEEATATAQDDLTISEPTYGVESAKSITPDSRTELESREGYTVRLTGQPTGTVRTTELTLTDDTATFWNAFAFAGFDSLTLPQPVEQVRVDLLTGVAYAVDGDDDLVQTCGGSADLDACWTEGVWLTAAGGGVVTAAQLEDSVTGVDLAEVQGIRYTVRRLDGLNWERPSNPLVDVEFSVDRREVLVYGIAGADDTPVPSTRPGLDPAPGEPVAGVFTDTVVVDATGSWQQGPSGGPWTATDSAEDTTTLTHVENGVSVTKVHGRENATTNQDTFYPGEQIPYAITVVNTGDWPIEGFTLVDQVQTDNAGAMLVEMPREYDDDTPIYTGSVDGEPIDPFTGALDTSTGVITFTFPDDFVLEPGAELVVTAALMFRQEPVTIDPGTDVDNIASVSSDRWFDTCEYTVQATWQDATEGVETCSSNTIAEPQAVGPIATSKAVRGVGAGVEGASPGEANVDDLGVIAVGVADPDAFCAGPNAGADFYATPCVPITRPGGIEEWRLDFTNAGNVPVTTIASIDVLPHVGDTGVILSGERDSRWSPVYLGNITSNFAERNATRQMWFATEIPNEACNAAEIESLTGVIAPENADCAAEVAARDSDLWQPYTDDLTPDELSEVVALKIVGTFGEGDALLPNETVNLTFQTQTPWYSEATANPATGEDPIAWNSLAAGSAGVYDGGSVQSRVVEPRKVGVALASGQLAFVKTVEDADPDWGVTFPDEYVFTLACTSGGEDVPLVGPDGADMSQVRIAADGTPSAYNDGTGEWGVVTLPLYAECTLTENAGDPSSQGAAVTYDPAGSDPQTSGEVAALRFSFGDDVVNPAETSDPAQATISAVNTYLEGGFAVRKDVVIGDDPAPGDPYAYDEVEYSFDAECTFLGSTVLDATFSLASGEAQEFTGLPAGAACTVTETDDRGADATWSRVIVDGDTGDQVDGAEAELTVEPYAAGTGDTVVMVAFTNSYVPGALEITKELAGAGAEQYGTGQVFTVDVVCAYDGYTVLDTQAELSAADDWTVRYAPLVAGSECTISEQVLSGADAVVVTPNAGDDRVGVVTVPAADDATAEITVTNWYLTGSLEVTKTFEGDGVPVYGTGQFVLTLSCVRDGERVDIPGSGIRIVDQGSPSAVWENLPTGSECTLAERGDGGATETGIYDADGDLLVSDAEAGYPFTVETDSTVLSVDDQPQPGLEVRNTFRLGQVSVRKFVVDFAVDGDGNPLERGPFTVELSCLYEGESVTAAEDMTQMIVGGETVTWTGLPEGAECVVTETEAGSAPLTVAVVVEDGEVAGATVGTSVALDPLPDADDAQALVVMVNAFATGDLTIRKVVDGTDAASVDRTFPVDVVCVLVDDSHPDPGLIVFDGSFEIGGPDDIVAVVEDLPAGADCTVTESDTGDADATTIAVDGVEQDGESVIVRVPRGDVEIVVTNTFDEEPPLPATGGTVAWSSALLALLLIGGGALFVTISRRRRVEV